MPCNGMDKAVDDDDDDEKVFLIKCSFCVRLYFFLLL